MSIASEITRINTNIAAAYTALDGKGATLPETQNSANLADTIDTITTGGGGNVTSSDYLALLSRLQSITTTVNLGEYYKNDFYYLGLEMPLLIGFVPTSNVMWFKKDCFKLFFPEDAVIDTENPETFNNKEWYKVTFTNDKYIIFCNEPSDRNLYIWATYFKNRLEDYSSDIINDVEYIAIKRLTKESRYAFTDFYLEHAVSCSTNHCISIENIEFTDNALNSASKALFLFMFYGGMNEGLKCFPNILNPSVSPSDMNIYSSGVYNYGSIVLHNDFTIPLNYAGLTGYDGIKNTIINPNKTNVLNLKILLPSTNWSWTGVQNFANLANTGFSLSDEALKFMADNAPTLQETCTLTLSQRCKVAPYWNTFKSAMEAKGWTVATA